MAITKTEIVVLTKKCIKMIFPMREVVIEIGTKPKVSCDSDSQQEDFRRTDSTGKKSFQRSRFSQKAHNYRLITNVGGPHSNCSCPMSTLTYSTELRFGVMSSHRIDTEIGFCQCNGQACWELLLHTALYPSQRSWLSPVLSRSIKMAGWLSLLKRHRSSKRFIAGDWRRNGTAGLQTGRSPGMWDRQEFGWLSWFLMLDDLNIVNLHAI